MSSTFWLTRMSLRHLHVMQTAIWSHSTYTAACPALAQGDYTHRHYQVANSVQQGLAIKCGLSMPHFEYEPQSVLEKSNCKLHCIWSIMIDRAVHNDKPHTVTWYNHQKLYLNRYSNWQQELTRIWQLKNAYTMLPALSTVATITNKLYKGLKLLSFLAAQHIVMQKALILNTRSIVRMTFAERWIRNV
jgi:hypothetical protein